MIKNIQGILAIAALLAVITGAFAQTMVHDSLQLPNGTYEHYYYQIPRNYSPTSPPPLLLGFHAYGASGEEPYYVGAYRDTAYAWDWLMLSITGVPTGFSGYSHWWSQRVLVQLDSVIAHFARQYPFDPDRIYAIGGSMGGAAGMQFHHRHLDPNGLMLSATAGGSGILDLARRFREQANNNSMRTEFGGPPDTSDLHIRDTLNFSYKRNSGVVFWDTTNSMHYNLKWLPLLQSSGIQEPHYSHDTDLYNLYGREMMTYVIKTEPNVQHGWPNLNVDSTMHWLLAQPRANRHPTDQNVSSDSPRRCYDIEFIRFRSDTSMARARVISDSMNDGGTWYLRNPRIILMRNAAMVKFYRDLPRTWATDSTTISNLDTLSVALTIHYPSIPIAQIVFQPELAHQIVVGNDGVNIVIPSVPSNYVGSVRFTSVAERPGTIPTSFQLVAYPNPFNSMAKVQIYSPVKGDVKLQLYDANGRSVREIPRRYLYAPGAITFSLPADGLPSGSYFIDGTVGGRQIRHRVTVLR